jgi:2-haloacid dehalogenase
MNRVTTQICVLKSPPRHQVAPPVGGKQQMAKRLSDYTTLTFDCYGTLIDWESGIWDAYQPLIMASGRDDITRDAALGIHAGLESAQQAQTPGMLYPQLLSRVHHGFANHHGITSTSELDAAFGASLSHWPAFPDTADALRRLKERYKLVILSNVNRAGFAASKRKLGVAFDAIYTAEDIGSYKPARRNFEYMLDRLAADHGVAPDQILHTAQSLFHDHVPAGDFGLDRTWIDRQGLSSGGAWGATAKVPERPQVDFLFPTMVAMADAVEAEG